MTSALVDLVRVEISKEGPIPFARFMELALAHPEHGYYTAGPARTTRTGDFLTAPELHPIFGRALARQLHEVWERFGRPDPFVLREDGAGSGTLGLTIIDGLAADGSALATALVYLPLDLSGERRAESVRRFAAAGLAGLLAASAGGDAPDPVRPFAGAVLANEYLDALPVHLVERRGGSLLEVFVDVAGAPAIAGRPRRDYAARDAGAPTSIDAEPSVADASLVEVLGEPSSPALAARLAGLGVELAEGQRAEICLALVPWADSVAADLGRGVVLVIDYGREATDLYDRRRMAGTLMTYRGHVADPSPDAPYRDVGARDITAHVDLTTVRALLAARGLAHMGTTSLAELLVGCGLEDLLERERGRAGDLQAALELRGAVQRLLDPRRLGGFRALLAGRGIDPEPELRGLAFKMPGRDLAPEPSSPGLPSQTTASAEEDPPARIPPLVRAGDSARETARLPAVPEDRDQDGDVDRERSQRAEGRERGREEQHASQGDHGGGDRQQREPRFREPAEHSGGSRCEENDGHGPERHPDRLGDGRAGRPRQQPRIAVPTRVDRGDLEDLEDPHAVTDAVRKEDEGDDRLEHEIHSFRLPEPAPTILGGRRGAYQGLPPGQVLPAGPGQPPHPIDSPGRGARPTGPCYHGR